MKYTLTFDVPKRRRPRKYEQIVDLEVGQGFRIPYTDISYQAGDPAGGPRSSASYWGKRLGRKYSTTTDATGIWIVRDE